MDSFIIIGMVASGLFFGPDNRIALHLAMETRISARPWQPGGSDNRIALHLAMETARFLRAEIHV